MASAVSQKIAEKRSRALLGPLPEDFLRINISAQEQQEAADRQAALALQQHYSAGSTTYVPNTCGRLSLTIDQAKLAKNYGIIKMDPYCRVRVGHFVSETPTDTNGGKNPRWNKVVYCLLPQGITTISIEIFDERSFTVDEIIAWTQITIPPKVLSGETHEDWYALTGKLGEGQEGMIHLVMSYSATAPYIYPSATPIMVIPKVGGSAAVAPVQVYPHPRYSPNSSTCPPPILSESELKQIQEMFPNIENEVIKTVFEANSGNKERTINSLLQMVE